MKAGELRSVPMKTLPPSRFSTIEGKRKLHFIAERGINAGSNIGPAGSLSPSNMRLASALLPIRAETLATLARKVGLSPGEPLKTRAFS
jgi:hypothetical protein